MAVGAAMIKRTTLYVTRSKEANWDVAVSLEIIGESAQRRFLYACCEVELGVDVDTETGLFTIVTCDGKPLQWENDNDSREI